MKNVFHQLIDLGEATSQAATVLLRQTKHYESHRAGIACRDLSLSIANALTVLSPELRKRIASA